MWRMPATDPVLFLTFDDGPNPEVTPQVLDILKSHQAKATFFCVGENIIRHRDVYDKILAGGHTVGNHTFHHLNGWKTKTKDYLFDVSRCGELLKTANGKRDMNTLNSKPERAHQLPCSILPAPNLFRPPYGKLSPAQYIKIKSQYSIVMWDVLSGDYNTSLSGENCFTTVSQAARSGSIILFHDSIKAKERVLFSLPKVMDYFSNKNFVFKSLSQKLF